MKIVSSAIKLDSERAYAQKSSTTERLRVVDGNRSIDVSRMQASQTLAGSRETSIGVFGGDILDLSGAAQGNGGQARGRGGAPGLAVGLRSGQGQGLGLGLQDLTGSSTEGSELDPDEEEMVGGKLMLTKKILEAVLKEEINITSVKMYDRGEGSQPAPTPEGSAQAPNAEQAQAAQPNGFGLRYERTTSHYEAEETNFAAQGVVKTEDGREIDFSVQLQMAREFQSQEYESLTIGQQIDPLVVNYGGSFAELTDQKFEFDLDSDGSADSVSFLKSNSGFLAFDRNGDGTINDGSELFGPNTGDGFAELAQYDEDGNNFIDEGDSIYSSLQLYNKSGDGTDQLTSLSDAGVGAIYLDNASTEFSINKTDTNEQLGQVRSSSVFIGEDGDVGTVQQVDLSA